ncbi:MAG: aldo/keto reductase [Candidatus Nanopelagicales bacterium]|jgi:2,5-diketo-D-gluconate reductase A
MPIDPSIVPNIALNDGTTIPQIGFGLWQVPPDGAEAATAEALAVGYRHVDSAAVYANEAEAGLAVARSGLAREDVYVTTKLWNPDHGYDEAMRAFDLSMGKLGFEYLDLYLIHWQCKQLGKYVDTWRALIDLQASGRVRSIGVSNFKETALREIIDVTGVVPVLNQIELHPWLPQLDMRAVHAEYGIATESWSPLASGQLIDDPLLATIAAKHGVSTAQVMIRWHLQQGLIVLPKSVTPTRIAENIDVFGFELDAEDLAAIATLESGRRTGPDPDDFFMLGWE